VTWQPFWFADLPAVNWAAILSQSGNIAIVVVLSVVSLLLNASALEDAPEHSRLDVAVEVVAHLVS
jgi:hypothetical protein